MASVMPIVPGTRLGPYEVTALVGAGGMGEVYKARDTRLDRTVAIKVLPPALAADPDPRARFEREARAISHLSHPHICALFDVGSTSTPEAGGPDIQCLVMEYLEGETLAARLARAGVRTPVGAPSPDGRGVAFVEHPLFHDSRGSVAVADATGRKTILTEEYGSAQGLAWSADAREIWFSAAAAGMLQSLFAVTLEGRLRTVARFPTSAIVQDVARDGRVLLVSTRDQTGIRGGSSADNKERELGWLETPWPAALSADGRMLLLEDAGETASPHYSIYLKPMDGSEPTKLGTGAGCALSPDGRWALAVHNGPPQRLELIPTGPGDVLFLPSGQVETYQYAGSFLPDGRRIVFIGAERGRPQRTWIQEPPGGTPHPVTPEGTAGATTSPDGRWVAALDQALRLTLFPLQGGGPRTVATLAPEQEVVQWSADGRTPFVSQLYRGPRLDVFGIDVESGRRRLWKTFEVPDPAGVGVATFIITRDARSYAYVYERILDELYLVEGLK